MPGKQQAPWYEIRSRAGTSRDEVFIYGVIVDYKWDEDDVTAREFIEALKRLGDLDLHVNSPGGSVMAGNAIYNALRRHKGSVHVYIDGLAASMASVIAMAGEKVIMPANAMLMIHDPWSLVVGNAAEMRKAAEALDKFKVGMVEAYREKSGLEAEEIERMMSEESWITAEEAAEFGFADELEEPVRMAAQFDLSRYNKVPRALQQPAQAAGSDTPTGKEQEMDLKALREKHPDLMAQVEAQAREGYIAQVAADEARTQAVNAESERLANLVNAAFGEETGGKLVAVAAKGLTAEDLETLGITFASADEGDAASRRQILDGLAGAAPAPVKGVKQGQESEATERSAAAAKIAAGASR